MGGQRRFGIMDILFLLCCQASPDFLAHIREGGSSSEVSVALVFPWRLVGDRPSALCGDAVKLCFVHFVL